MMFLPKIFLVLFIFLSLLFIPPAISAVAPSPASSPTGSSSPFPSSKNCITDAKLGTWCEDQEVTFVGKLAARSADLLNGVIEQYKWSEFDKEKNPFIPIWITIRNIVYALLSLFILAGAFLIIITRGQSITVKKFIPRFIFIAILIALSFSVIQIIYISTDMIQGFFLFKDVNGVREIISAKDLLNIAFDYENFHGFRRIDGSFQFEESAFISLLLVKLTAVTYYVMFIVLIIRKVILWFFIIVSPIFPLLLFFSPIRNTAKIWLGEFFRWLLYGPLFAIFLAGLVALWQIGIPIKSLNAPCEPEKQPGKYPTAINILLGGPCQKLAFDPDKSLYNNINIPQSFTQYVVALLMLWMVIIMPFILLKIFLDYFNSLSLQDNGLLPYLFNSSRPKPKPPAPLPKASPHFSPAPMPITPLPPITPEASTGLTRELSRAVDLTRNLSHLKPEVRNNSETQKSVAQILETSNLRIPTLRDVAKYDTNSNGIEASKIAEAIKRVAGTSTIMSSSEQQQAVTLRAKIETEAQKGNPVANSIKKATEKQSEIPEENEVQTVSVEDYEEVKKTWLENYRNQDVPVGPDGDQPPKKNWLKQEVEKISQAISLLLSAEKEKQDEGKNMVSNILPFLLLGGFSKNEIVAYLKAKMEAAKEVLAEVERGEKDEDSKVYVESKKAEQSKDMTVEQKIPEDSDKNEEGQETNALGEKPVELYPKTETSEIVEGVKIEDTPEPKPTEIPLDPEPLPEDPTVTNTQALEETNDR